MRIREALLVSAAETTGRALGVRVRLEVPANHPARGRRVSLTMTADEPADALNAVSAAYGLRWIAGAADGREVILVDKERFRSQSAGLRQAMADAVSPGTGWALTGPAEGRLGRVEGILKAMPAAHLAALEQATREGPVPLDRLDAQVGAPLLQYLETFTVYRLGRIADEYHRDRQAAARTPVVYGAPDGVTKQFGFRLPRSFLTVAPE